MEGCRRRLRRKLEHGKEEVVSFPSPCRHQASSRFEHSGLDSLDTTPRWLTRHRSRSKLSLENLPEDLLCNVLSKLTVKEAGRTSILSSRWRNRWTCHSNLCFDGSNFPGCDTNRFIKHVNSVLQQHKCSVVEKFEVRFALWKEHTHHVDRLVGFSAALMAKCIILDFRAAMRIHHQRERNMYKLPVNLIGGENKSCIESLFLSFVWLKIPSDFLGFNNLQKLELVMVSDLGNITFFLAKCPALVWLSIAWSSLFDLNIPYPLCHLQYLKISDCNKLQSIELHAMSLTSFEYVGGPIPIKFDDSLKLSQARISIKTGYDNINYIVNELSCSLAHVDRLFLTFRLLTKTISSTKKLVNFIHLRHLVLDFHIYEEPKNPFDILQVTRILEAVPQLELFILHMGSYKSEPSSLKVTNCISPRRHSHLKTVHMTGVYGLAGQFELAKYILLSAEALEHMTLDLAKERYPHAPWVLNPFHVLTLEGLAKRYLDPQGVHRGVLNILGLNVTN